MARALTLSLALLLVAALPQLGHAQSQDAISRARAHYQQGLQFFEAGNYHSAITEFGAADKIAPSPLLDYNMGLCYERLGDTDKALQRYRAYRVRAPNAANRATVDDKIARLERAVSTRTPDPPVGDPPVGDPPVGDPPVGDPPVGDPPVANPSVGAAPTGDAELDRVAAVDVNSVAARHPGVAAAPAAQPGQPLGSNGARANTGAGAGAGAATPPPKRDKPKSKPLYKRWWFWVIIGVSSLILLNIALSSNDGDDNNFRALDPSMALPAMAPPGQAGGYTIRF